MTDGLRPRVLGRYALHGEIASGGMASVEVGRLLGLAGFTPTVAIKRLHPHFAKDPEFAAMLLDEARLASRIRHPNVVRIVDVVAEAGELLLVMDYVHGAPLSQLLRAQRARAEPAPTRVVAAVLSGILHGLHAAHEARSERGEPLGIVHRDVSPENVLVAAEGVALVLDFGIAKATSRLQTTREGRIKGKLAYMAPEQLEGRSLNRTTDVYSAAVVLWEALAGRRLFEADNDYALGELVRAGRVEAPSRWAPVPPALDAVALRGLRRDPEERFPTAREMALAIEASVGLATPTEVADWVDAAAGPELRERAARIAAIEAAAATPSGPASASAPIADDDPTRQLVARSGPVVSDEATSDAHTVSLEQLAVEPPDAPTRSARLPTRRPGPRGRWPLAVLLMVGGVGLLGLIGARLGSRGMDRVEAVAPGGSGSSVPLGTGRGDEPTVSAPAILPEPPRLEVSATAATTGSNAAAARTGPPQPSHRADPGASCNPPYVIDARGIRRIKRECVPRAP